MENITVGVNRSFYEPTDLKGFNIDVAYSRYLTKRISLYGIIGTSFHNGIQARTERDLFTNALQTGLGAGYSFIGTNAHELILQTGPILRYQFGKHVHPYKIIYEENYPFNSLKPVYDESSRDRNFEFGFIAIASYLYAFKNNLLIGANIKYQNDIDGNLIKGYGISFGKRF